MVRRIIEAIYLGSACHFAARGDVTKALRLMNRIKEPRYNRATAEALRADLSVVNGQQEAAVRSIQLCRDYVQKDGKCGEFLLPFCSYLEALMKGDVDEFNRLSALLSSQPKCFAKDMLKVVKPVSKQELAALGVDRMVSRLVH